MKNTFIVISMILLLILTLNAQNKNLLYDMDALSGWVTFQDGDKSQCELSTVPGKEDQALAMEFDLGTGGWAGFRKEIRRNLVGFKRLQFYYKYEGQPNTLEIKIVDGDGSIFVSKMNIQELNDWDFMEIALSQFEYGWGGQDEKLDLNNISKFEFAILKRIGGKGHLIIDQVSYSKQSKQDFQKNIITKAGTAVIDEFERINPLAMYVPLKNDDSELSLTTSRQYVFKENYAMELEYELNTTKAYPSSVSAHWSGKEPLDWNAVEEMKIWVRGDGSGNYFRINIIDGSGELWSYEDQKVLLSKKWQLITIPLDQLSIPVWAEKNNGVFEKEKIKGYEISIAGRTPELSTGKIYVDHFYLTGKDLISLVVTPKEVLTPITLLRPQDNFDIRGYVSAEYKSMPSEGSYLASLGRVMFEAKLMNMGLYTELTIAYKKYSEIVAIDDEGELLEHKPTLESTHTRFYINHFLPYLDYITIGNLWLDFSDYTFSPYHTKKNEWGYKGVYAEGDITRFSYQLFILTHQWESYSWGMRTSRSLLDIFFRGILVEYVGRAKIKSDGKIEDGIIKKDKTGDLKTKLIDKDRVFTIECDKHLFKFLRLRALYGEDYKVKYAEADYSDPFDPIYNYDIYPIEKSSGHLIKGEIEIKDMPLKDANIYGNFRDVDNDYKPKYRRKPEEFDELISNQTGGNIRLSQGFKQYLVMTEFDYFKRKNNLDKYRKWFMWGFGRFGLYGFDLFYQQEFRWQDDSFERWLEENLVNKDEKMTAHVVKITYHFSSKANVITETRMEDLLNRDTNVEYSSGKLYLKIEYFISGNSKIYSEYQFLRIGDPNWRSITDDNYFKVVAEINF